MHGWDMQYELFWPSHNTTDNVLAHDVCSKLWVNFILYG